MRKKFFSIALGIIFATIPGINHAQENWNDYSNSISDTVDYNFTDNRTSDSSYYDCANPYESDRFNDPTNAYSTPDYSYNSYYYTGNMHGASRNSNTGVEFGRNFDNSDNFTSGISSYQGTSTGPGPNGGYPGAPSGVYPTKYIDPSIQPSSYKRF